MDVEHMFDNEIYDEIERFLRGYKNISNSEKYEIKKLLLSKMERAETYELTHAYNLLLIGANMIDTKEHHHN